MTEDAKKGIMFNVDPEKYEEIINEAKTRRQTIKAYILSLHDLEMDRVMGKKVLEHEPILNSSQNQGFKISNNIYVSNNQAIWILIIASFIFGAVGLLMESQRDEPSGLLPLYLVLLIISLPFVTIRLFTSFPVDQFQILLRLILGLAVIVLLLSGQTLVLDEGDYFTSIIFSSSVLVIGIIIIHFKTDIFSKRIDQLIEYYKNRFTNA